MVEQVLPHIYHIHVPLPGNPLKELNSYLIKDDGRNLLIDTGFRQEACREALQTALDELGVRREETDVLLTHRHNDHAGMADLFSGKDRKIYVSAIERPILDGTRRKWIRETQNARFLAEGFSHAELEELETKNPARVLGMPEGVSNFSDIQDGDVMEVAGYKLKAIHTPGHTPGHLCFWLEEQGAMFLGDHVLFTITPNITSWPDMPDALGQYLKSLKAIRSYDVEFPLPAHRQVGNFKERIDQLLLHHDRRLNETLNIIKANPGWVAYDIAGKMTWSIRCNSWEDFPIVQKWFAVGECMSHLDRLMAEGMIAMEERDGLRHYHAI